MANRPERQLRQSRLFLISVAAFCLILAAAAAQTQLPNPTEYPVDTLFSGPAGITVGPDGAIWFTQPNATHSVGRITTAGLPVTYFPSSGTFPDTPTGAIAASRTSLFLGANKSIVAIGTDGSPQAPYPLPDQSQVHLMDSMAWDGASAVWFTDFLVTTNTRAYGKLNLSSGIVTENSLASGDPCAATVGGRRNMTKGPDGAMWFTAIAAVCRINFDGSLTPQAIPADGDPSPQGGGEGIATGPDGRIWVGQYAGGTISQSGGPLNVGGASQFTVTAASSDVLLGGFGNLFSGGVTLAVSGAGAMRDVSLRDASATPTLSGLPAALRNLTLQYDNAGVSVPAVNVSGNLGVTANGPIADSGSVTVAGATSFAAGTANNITLSQADDFVGPVSVSSGKDVTLVDVNQIVLGASTVAGKLNVTAGGSISQSGLLSVGGASQFTVTAAGSDVLLGVAFANQFNGGVTLAVGGAGTVRDVALRDAAATPSLSGLPATLRDLTLQYDNAGVNVPAVNVTGNLGVTANGPITDAGALSVAGATGLAAGSGNTIALSHADDFVGPVSIVSGKDVTLNDINALTLGASRVSGNLTVTANGPITDAGALSIAGTTSLAAGAANDISLSQADDFAGAVSILSGKNVTLNEINGLTLGASTVFGTLNVTAGGSINQSGLLSVNGASRFTVTTAGSDVLLGGFGNLFNGGVSLAVSGAGTVRDVSLRDASATPLLSGLPVSLRNLTLQYDNAGVNVPAVNVSGNLGLSANGPISDGGVVTVAGTTTLKAGPGNNIAMSQADDFVGPVSIVSGKDVTLNDANAITLGASTIAGNLKVTASGLINDSGSITVVGLTTLAAGAGNDITMVNADDFGGAVSIQSGRNVTLKDQNSINLGASTIAGTLAVTSGGDGIAGAQISQSGILSVSGFSTFRVAANNSDVLLGTFANLFQGVALAAAGGSFQDVSIRDAALVPIFVTGLPVSLRNLSLQYDNAGVNLPAISLSGNLLVTANGAINDRGIVTVAGTTSLSAGAGNNITLSQADDFVGTLSIVSGKDVMLNDINALTLGGSTISGNLTATTKGALTDAGAVTVAGTTSLSAGAPNDITLNHADDFVGSVTVSSAKDVTLVDVNQIVLGASTVSGKLDVTAGGSISQSGQLTVSGASKFTTTAANSDLLLGVSFANLFNGGVTFAVSGAGSVRDVSLRDAASTPALSGLPVSLRDLTLQYDNAGVSVPAVNVTGNLGVTANGPITDSGVVRVTGTTSLTAGSGNNITLSQPDDFGGAVSIVSGKDVTLNDINALTLGASTVSGSLKVTASGLISDSGNLTVAGTTTLSAGSANDITLTKADDFVGALSIVSGRNVVLKDLNSINLGASTIAGTLDVTSGGNGTAGAQISESGVLSVGGLSTFRVAANNSDVLVGSFANLFNGVSLATAGGGFQDVSIRDASAVPIFVTGLAVSLRNLTLQYDNAGVSVPAVTLSGNLLVTANGPVTDGGVVTVAGTTSLAAGAANNITLSQADDFVGPVSIVGGKDVTLNDINALTLGASAVSGNLKVTSSGLISDSGVVTVAGGTSLAAGAGNNISLSQADDFVGPVSIVSGKDVTLNDINALTLGASTVSGNLKVTAGGLISDSGVVTVAGGTSLAAGAGNNITLSQADDFVGPVSIVSGKDVTLNDINALTLGVSTVSGDLKVTAGGLISDSGVVTVAGGTSLAAGAGNNITLSQADDFVGPVSIVSGKDVTLNDINALTLGASTVSGNLKVTAGGLISDSGVVTVAGGTSLAAGAGNNITLSQADDFVGPVSIVSGKDVTLNDINALTLGASTVSGNLKVTSSGLISDSGVVKVTGTTSLAAGAGNNITLSQADDFIGPVSIVSGKDVTLNDINALTLGASTVSGNLKVTTAGLINDSGVVKVTGATSLAAGAGNNITLSQADDFIGPVSIVSGKDVTLNDINALTLGASTVSGNLKVTASGLISDSGVVTVAGGTSLAAGVGNNIALSQADDFIGPVSIVSGKDVTLNDINALTLGASAISGNLKVTASGLISDSGVVTVAGGTSLAAGAGNNITLSQADDFVGPVSIVSGKDVTLNDINALTLGASAVSGNLKVTSSGLISDSGVVTVAGGTSLAAGAGNNITLSQADDFVGPVSIVSGKDVTLNDINALTLGASAVSGNLKVTSSGLISDSGVVTVAGGTSLAAGAGNNITLSQADDFVGPVSIVSGKDVTLNDINALTLGASTVSGNLKVTAGGLISDSGVVTVAGGTSLAAGAGNNITLSQADDFVGPVSIVSGKDVTLNDINALTLGVSTVSGDLKVTAGGLISDSGVVTVVGGTRAWLRERAITLH